MKRKRLWVGLFVLLGVGLLWLVLDGALDLLATHKAEAGATEALGAGVEVESGSFSLFSGRMLLRSITVANPDGFEGGDAARVEEITVDLDSSSLLSGPLVIHEIRCQDTRVNLKIAAKGTNVGKLLGGAQKREPEGMARRKVVLGRVVVEGTKVHIVGSPSAPISLPKMKYTPEDPSPRRAQYVVTGILAFFYSNLAEVIGGVLPVSQLDVVRREVADVLQGAPKLLEGMTDTFGSAIDALTPDGNGSEE